MRRQHTFWRRGRLELLESRQLLTGDLVINEILASNSRGIHDEDGDSSDWIELLNAGANPISLADYSLTDDPSDLREWRFPDVTLDPNDTLLVFASGKDRRVANEELHTSFRLAASGEYLALVEPDGQTIASDFQPTFPPQQTDVSYGRDPTGTGYQFYSVPTPGALNDVQDVQQQVVLNEIMYHPDSNQPSDEFIEIYNAGAESVDLAGWRFVDGVEYTFPDTMLPAGEMLVVAADIDQFSETYGQIDNLVGAWTGRLSDQGETLTLLDAAGRLIDTVTYADEGNWATRIRGELDRNHRGWAWSNAHDGDGHSLELSQPNLDNNVGQNWAASELSGGTPGQRNSANVSDAAPMIDQVSHHPVIPSSGDVVSITARVMDEAISDAFVQLHWRVDGESNFRQSDMQLRLLDAVNQGVFVATLPPHDDRTVIEFFIAATDASGTTRRYPNVDATSDEDTEEGTANLLYQVDDAFTGAISPQLKDETQATAQPTFRLIMTEAERAELEGIGAGNNANTNAQMNGTFVSFDGDDVEVRYNVGIRNRGKSSRDDPPNNFKVNFATDQPWNDVESININAESPYAQVIGSAFFHEANVVAANATAVQVRVNGNDLSTSDGPMYGSYAYLQVIDSDFYEHHFPMDGDGNGYTGSWISRNQADLRYEGSDPDAYRDRYTKDTNANDDDWTDLLELIDVLNNTPDEQLLESVELIADVDQWLRYLAVDTLMTNRETSPSNGIGDDYRIYRGQSTQRFVFVPHDLDSIFGITSSRTDYDIWEPAELDGITRLLTLPEVARRYYATLESLMNTVFSTERAETLVRQMLDSWVPRPTQDRILSFLAGRREFVRSRIPTELTANADSPQVDGLYESNSSTIRLSGVAPASRTVTVEVNGQEASYDVRTGEWEINLRYAFGLNRFHVTSLNADGSQSGSLYVDVLRRPNPVESLAGTVGTDLSLRNGVAYRVTEDLLIPAGTRVDIEPGTLVTVDDGVSIRVEGELQAIGNATAPIRFTRSESGRWNGLSFVDTQQPNRLEYVDLAYSDGNDESILVDRARLDLDHVGWHETTGTTLELNHPTVTVTNSRFPSVEDNETIHGVGLEGEEQFVLQGNTFGSTTGYSDIIDFTGGQRPGPIVQVLDNVFFGGSDDGLDFDGTDAYIAGNVFHGIRKANTSDSSSNAIATGVDSGNASELVIVGNVFHNVENALLLKERSSAIFHNNVVINAEHSAINMDEPNRDVDPGASIEIRDSIFWQVDTLLNNIEPDPAFGVPQIRVEHSIVPAEWASEGIGNFVGDPGFEIVGTPGFAFSDADPLSLRKYALRADSPANSGSSYGGNIGLPDEIGRAAVEIAASTDSSWTLNVSGPDIVAYHYRIAPEEFSDAVDSANSVELHGLPSGEYTVEVLGIDSLGNVQDATQPTSVSWTVGPPEASVQLSEIYAGSEGSEDDWIELYNPSSVPVDLSGFGLSDDSNDLYQFQFPEGTHIPAYGYLTLYAVAQQVGEVGFGFGLRRRGDQVILSSPATGDENGDEAILDSVEFGRQLPSYSIGRAGQGETSAAGPANPTDEASSAWQLTNPTPNAPNEQQPTGPATQLRINEWYTSGEVRLTDDFVEIANTGVLPVDLAGLFLSDVSYSWPDQHRIAELTFVAGNSHLAFIADGDTSAGADHINFRLSQSTGQIGLYDRDLRVLDRVHYQAQQQEVSEGIDANGGLSRFTLPTPNLPNDEEIVATERREELVSLTGEWKYDDSGQELGTEWRSPSFDDSTWSVGIAPFGVESSALPIPIATAIDLGSTTYYFRTTFEFSGDAGRTDLFLETMLDDGAVFYLNGQELQRINMPSGLVDFETSAEDTVSNATLSDAVRVPSDLLQQGTNWLAVEVHQASTNSSDIVFAAGVESVQEEFVPPANTSARSLLESLRITEVMATPAGGSSTEFIELQNQGANPLQLAGVGISGGVDFVFPELSLAPGQFILVVNDVDAFRDRYGDEPELSGARIAGQFQGNLANEGETIMVTLPAPTNVAIHRFRFQPQSPRWPAEAIQDGRSLEVLDTGLDYSVGSNWTASHVPGGTPGKPATAPMRGDVNADGVVDVADIDLLFAAVRQNEFASRFDIDGDGELTPADSETLVTEVLGTFMGDANLDRRVDFGDFLILSASFGRQASWETGDFDGDGRTEFADFLVLSSNFGRSKN